MQRQIRGTNRFWAVLVLVTTSRLFAGSVPSADTRLEYIESTGTQYIDTGVTCTAGDYDGDGLIVEADVMWTDFTVDKNNPWETLVGAQNASGKTISPIRADRSRTDQPGFADLCFDGVARKWWETGTFYREGCRCTVRAVLATGANSLSSDGLVHYTNAGTPLATGSASFFIFAENVKGTGVQYPAWARCYGLKMWKGGALVRDFVPLRRTSDGALGLFDLVGETFYANVGTGDFLAGPDHAIPECGGIARMVGGETTLLTDNSRLHVFTNSGTLTVTGNGTVDVLVVGGGGGGGMAYGGGGGGGGGGVIYRQSLTVTGGVYTVTVGAGGHGPSFAESKSDDISGGAGEDSSVFGLIASGGGGGGKTWGTGTRGGCGGGAGATMSGSLAEIDGASGTLGQGCHGGKSSMTVASKGYAGGGGGAGAAAVAADATAGTWGIGGDGRLCSITGEDVYYGGGGGGGTTLAFNRWTPGGNGGGGAGGSRKDGSTNNAGKDGTPNTGGGGGGAGHYGGVNPVAGGNGGSGIVIVRYVPRTDENFEEVTTVGATRKHDGDYDVYTFADVGAASSFTVRGNSLIDVLIVAGGGGGGAGYASGGGGGGGGVIYRRNLLVMEGTYGISVGGGGRGGKRNANYDLASYSEAGTNSTAFGLVAHGGGRGGNTNEGGGSKSASGEKAGSGGGGAGYRSNTDFMRLSGGDRTEGQGNYGGWSTNAVGWKVYSGGGGGASENGADGTDPRTETSGTGGDGFACSISGEEKYYGGGGGGGMTCWCVRKTTGIIPGGLGGGGYGNGRGVPANNEYYDGTDGAPGTGGGGGGAGAYPSKTGNGGNGGSGIVIIRCHRRKPGFSLLVK